MPIIEIKSVEDFTKIIKGDGIAVVHFYENWAAQCGVINEVIEELNKLPENKEIKFLKCPAEELSELSLQYKITAVPTVLLLFNGKLTDTINGANSQLLIQKLNDLVGKSNKSGDVLIDRLKKLINQAEVMVFMKGNPAQPRCGFSRTLISILNETKVPFNTFDILEDNDVRQGLKEFSDWPTYPQIYVKGELIGGIDIIKELKEEGQLVATLKPQ